MQQNVPWFLRFLSKLVLDILPAALASVIGGFLFTQYHFGHVPKPKLVQVTPASEEMMRLVRDEHAMIVDFLKAQMVAEKSKQTVERDQQVKAIAEAAKANAAAFNARRLADAGPIARQASARSNKMAPAAHAATPAAVVAARPLEIVESPALVAQPVHESHSLVAKAAELKDNVVAATRRVAATIVDIPSWLTGNGDRSSSAAPTTESTASRLVNASW
jgi:hypothetical protein